MSNGEEPALAAQKGKLSKEEMRLRRRQAQEGVLIGEGRKETRLGTLEARNGTEQLWMEKFGSVTPIPAVTLRRSQQVMTCAVLRIHFSMGWKELERITKVDADYLQKVAKEDKWDEFGQVLTQMTKPSLLSLVPQHDMDAISKETKRRIATIEDLIQKEEALVKLLPKCIGGSLQESGVLSNIKKIRDLIEKSIGLDAYLKESHEVRKQVNAAQVKVLTGEASDAPLEPRSTKGTVIPL